MGIDVSQEVRDFVSAFDRQVGGDHYKKVKIQPWEYIAANDLDYWQGTILKYIHRWRDKNGLDDLEKARHTLDAYIEKVKDGTYSRSR